MGARRSLLARRWGCSAKRVGGVNKEKGPWSLRACSSRVAGEAEGGGFRHSILAGGPTGVWVVLLARRMLAELPLGSDQVLKETVPSIHQAP
jgi:hypothetical protein